MQTINKQTKNKDFFITDDGVKVKEKGKPNILLLARKLLEIQGQQYK